MGEAARGQGATAFFKSFKSKEEAAKIPYSTGWLTIPDKARV